MALGHRVLTVLLALSFLAGCATAGISTSESFDDASPDALLIVGLSAKSDPGAEHGMTWWPYSEETGEFIVGSSRKIEVVRSKFDSWTWGGAGMTEKKFIVVRTSPGLYALQSHFLWEFVNTRSHNSLLIGVESGQLNYIGDFVLSVREIEPYIGMGYFAEPEFNFDYVAHDIQGIESEIGRYPNVRAELRTVTPRKLVVN